MSELLDDLDARGLIHETTDRSALAARLAEGPITLYYGCDPTAPSLHVGNLIGLLILRRFQDAGHRPIALAGGATGMIGDPSGRSEERNLQDDETLAANVARIRDQMARVLGAGARGAAGVRLVDNRDWTARITLLEFLRDVGKHVTVNQMLARESVRNRIQSEQGISYTEFSYMLLQAHDYLWLHEHEACVLQVGGSDQWGNIVSGVDLIRRVRGEAAHGLCWPLLTAPDGTKLGKTTGARVWLDAELTSPYAFYQHWIQVPDDDVERQLCWFTLLPLEEIREIVATHRGDPARRVAQQALAHAATAIVHGSDAARAAEEASSVLFGAGDVATVSAEALVGLVGEVPVAELGPDDDLEVGIDPAVLLERAGVASSRGDARRALEQGGVTVNGERAAPGRLVGAEDLLHGRFVLLRKGKKGWALVDRGPSPTT